MSILIFEMNYINCSEDDVIELIHTFWLVQVCIGLKGWFPLSVNCRRSAKNPLFLTTPATTPNGNQSLLFNFKHQNFDMVLKLA